MDYLNVKEKLLVDESVLSWEMLSFDPFNPTKLNNNDEIRIAIQQTGKYALPCKSELYIEMSFTGSDGKKPKNVKLINNFPAFLFKEMRYVLNGVTIDAVRDLGITSTLKGYVSYNTNESLKLQNAGWYPKTENDNILLDDNGNLSLSIPLKMYSGFFEDYNKIILNSHQELILIRSNTDDNIFQKDATTTETPKIQINRICWRVPHLTVGIPQELALTKIIDNSTDILVSFRSWELIENPELLQNTKHVWPIKTSTKVETPRHILFALSTNRFGNSVKDCSQFDHCTLRNLTVFLNSERYPYQDLQLNFKSNKFNTLYEMFSEFRNIYYNYTTEPLFTPSEFQKYAPIAYINCVHQRDVLQAGPVTMRIEFETDDLIPAKTSAFCLILHDKVFSYNPLTKIVKQL